MAWASPINIELATGPYIVTPDNARSIANTISFRHYKPEELQLARDFIASGRLCGTWFFDVYLETPASKDILKNMGVDTAGEAIPWMSRIDALCHDGESVHIIEFKTRLRPTGIGELLTYKLMMLEQYPTKDPIKLDYVVKYDSPEHHPVLEAHSIRLWIV